MRVVNWIFNILRNSNHLNLGQNNKNKHKYLPWVLIWERRRWRPLRPSSKAEAKEAGLQTLSCTRNSSCQGTLRRRRRSAGQLPGLDWQPCLRAATSNPKTVTNYTIKIQTIHFIIDKQEIIPKFRDRYWVPSVVVHRHEVHWIQRCSPVCPDAYQ